VPTGFIFLCFMGTLWKGRATFAVPMLFCMAWAFNFLIGGATGVVLSDVATDAQLHGGFFVVAHFHYTIVGGLVFAFFGAIYYWVPKMTGLRFNERLAKWHFWLMFISFNCVFLGMFVLGLKGMPRRVSQYESNLVGVNTWVSISAFVLGFSMLIFIVNVIYSQVLVRLPAEQNPWKSRSLEWQLKHPIPVNNFEQIPVFNSDPYPYGTPVPAGGGLPAAAGAGA
jgi:cytochrome c oxidase subunit 1